MADCLPVGPRPSLLLSRVGVGRVRTCRFSKKREGIMKRKLWIIAMSLVILALSHRPSQAQQRHQGRFACTGTCSTVFDCDWSCTICDKTPGFTTGNCR